MKETKLIIYLKTSDRPITITNPDHDISLSELKKQILNIYQSDEIITISTKKDFFTARSSQIVSIMLSVDGEMTSDDDYEIQEINDDEIEVVN